MKLACSQPSFLFLPFSICVCLVVCTEMSWGLARLVKHCYIGSSNVLGIIYVRLKLVQNAAGVYSVARYMCEALAIVYSGLEEATVWLLLMFCLS